MHIWDTFFTITKIIFEKSVSISHFDISIEENYEGEHHLFSILHAYDR